MFSLPLYFFACLGSVGPLHSDRQYDISASKEGFVLSHMEGTQGDFKAFALAGITFKVDLHYMFYISVIQLFLHL